MDTDEEKDDANAVLHVAEASDPIFQHKEEGTNGEECHCGGAETNVVIWDLAQLGINHVWCKHEVRGEQGNHDQTQQCHTHLLVTRDEHGLALLVVELSETLTQAIFGCAHCGSLRHVLAL